jgi:alcohol dehydrogenase (cytochrome c)
LLDGAQSGSIATIGLLFVGDASGYFYTVDARAGETLWRFNTSASRSASLVGYRVNHGTFVSVASGGDTYRQSPKSLGMRNWQ